MKPLATNKRARFDYDIRETYEAGIVLSGQEVKSAKTGHASLKGSFVTIRGNELFLTNASIQPYVHAGSLHNYDPTQPRKLLLGKREIKRLIGLARTEGLTLVPITLYTKKRYIKLSFGVGKGKKEYDKRAIIGKREAQRRIERALKR